MDTWEELEDYLKGALREVQTNVIRRNMSKDREALFKRQRQSLIQNARRAAEACENDTQACEALMAWHPMPQATAVYYLKQARRTLRAEAMVRRNRRIVGLARRGLTNAAISREVNLSPSTVAKIIARSLKEAQ